MTTRHFNIAQTSAHTLIAVGTFLLASGCVIRTGPADSAPAPAAQPAPAAAAQPAQPAGQPQATGTAKPKKNTPRSGEPKSTFIERV